MEIDVTDSREETFVVLTGDNNRDSSALALHLEELGHSVTAVGSLDLAKKALASEEIDVAALVIDWARSDEERQTLLAWLRDVGTQYTSEIVIQCEDFVPEDLGPDDAVSGSFYYLPKSSGPRQIQAILRAAVNGYRLRRAIAERKRRTKNTFRLMQHGEFHFRTYAEAEILAFQIGSAFGDPDDIVGILELLVNAVEHGNLEITYDEKSALLEEGTLWDEMQRRLALPKYGNRIARIKFRRRESAMEIEISDEGPGFEFSKYLTLDRSRLFESHGRGILLANASLDIKYFPPGNRVRLRLPLHDDPTA